MSENTEEITKFFYEESDSHKTEGSIPSHEYSDENEDDFDSEYYENSIGELQDENDPELNEWFDSLSEEEMEEFVSSDNIEDIIPSELIEKKSIFNALHNDLRNAKKARLDGKYQNCISICKDLLSISKNYQIRRYATNLLIAAYGDLGDPKAFELAIQEMNLGNINLDFQNTLFGLLKQDELHYPDNFLKLINDTQPYVLENYYKNLGQTNPKREVIWNAIHGK